MKKGIRKLKSVGIRDLWDSPVIFYFYPLSVDRIKHKLKHIRKKDRKIKGKLEEVLAWKIRGKKEEKQDGIQ